MILFMDDEPTTDLFYNELEERGLPVRRFDNVDEAWDFLDRTSKPLDLAIIDVMMPPGELFSDIEVSDGLHTGLEFYRLLRQRYPAVIIYLLTNLTQPIVARTIENDRRAYLAVKTDRFYDELAEEIEELYRKSVR